MKPEDLDKLCLSVSRQILKRQKENSSQWALRVLKQTTNAP
jgi:hypothetical protein